MKVEHQHLIRIPIDELRGVIREQYGVELAGVEPSIEGGNIVFTLDVENQDSITSLGNPLSLASKSKTSTRRKRKHKRNRIRTKGWNIVAKIRNSEGLVANIYEPIVKGLEGKELARSQQFIIVRDLLTSNGNRPANESINYFLNNTLEYLRQKNKEGEHE